MPCAFRSAASLSRCPGLSLIVYCAQTEVDSLPTRGTMATSGAGNPHIATPMRATSVNRSRHAWSNVTLDRFATAHGIPVAETQAGALLKDSVQPKIDAFDAFLKSLKKQDQASFDAVNSELATLKERNRLMQLADRAVTDGDRKALEKLIKLQNDETNPLAALAGSLTLQVKNFYLFGNRLGDYKLLLHRFDLSDNQLPGLPPSPESYSTGDLVAGLRDSEDWRARAKCADLLGSRKVKSVPEALLAAVQTDNHLEVVRNALRSFSIVTGYSSPDVFAYEPAEDWWREHMDEINRTLPDR